VIVQEYFHRGTGVWRRKSRRRLGALFCVSFVPRVMRKN